MKNVLSFALVTLATQSVFAWSSFTNDYICKSSNVEVCICHSAAPSEGGNTDIRSLKVYGKTYSRDQLRVPNYTNTAGYGMVDVISAQIKETVQTISIVRNSSYFDLEGAIVVFKQKIQNKEGETKLVSEDLSCQQLTQDLGPCGDQ